jgi:hypothetical protein
MPRYRCVQDEGSKASFDGGFFGAPGPWCSLLTLEQFLIVGEIEDFQATNHYEQYRPKTKHNDNRDHTRLYQPPGQC